MEALIHDLWRNAFVTAGLVAAPFLGTALVIGLVTAIIQAATQLQENVIAFVPKLVGIGIALAVGGHFALAKLVDYGTAAITSLGEVGEAGRP